MEEAYWGLVVKDIQDACELFHDIYKESNGEDGHVSVEVSPRLAHETDKTVEAAKWLHKVVNQPNVHIKIPATADCVPAVKTVISLGISVNVTVSGHNPAIHFHLLSTSPPFVINVFMFSSLSSPCLDMRLSLMRT